MRFSWRMQRQCKAACSAWVLGAAFLACAVALPPAAVAMEAGAAKVEITPPLGTPLNGYFDRLGRGCLSVHDPVWARCLFLDDGQTRLFIVSADLCVINRELRQRVLELAPPEVPKSNIILCATHTHSAQGAMIESLLFRTVSGRFMPEILETTAQRFAEAMRNAYAARKRATLGYTTFEQKDLSANRRQAGGPIDPQVGVIRVEDADGAPIAILTNFAAHPTSVSDADILAVSADYVGSYYTELERLTDPACVALFLNGTEANQTCANPENVEGWDRTASIGRILAQRVAEASEAITCGPATLKVGYAEPTLPLTLSDTFMPANTVLHTVEIDNLLMAFLPGETCVEIGLELRRRALARGYAAEFSIGLADDYLLYFIPRAFYSELTYESGMNFYGPAIEDWIYTEFAKLMTQGTPPAEPAPPAPPTVAPLGAGRIVQLAGTAYEIGQARGAAFAEEIREAYQRMVVAPCESGAWIPNSGLWRVAPSFLNLTPLALSRLAIGARPMTSKLAPGVLEEIEGMASGAQMAFDAIWLLHCAPVLAAQTPVEPLYRAPFCTMFAALGDRAGADDLLVGRNLDWAEPQAPVVFDVRPKSGRRFVHVGFPWSVGAFTGMNETGLVVCAERVESLGMPSIDGPPVELVLRSVLNEAGSLAEALAILDSATHLRGYHILVVDPAGPEGRVVECGVLRIAREPERGLLLGIEPESTTGGEDGQRRYARLSQLLEGERIIAADEIARVLQDSDPAAPDGARIRGPLTRYSVIFEPKAKRLRVAFPDAEGRLGEYLAVNLKEQRR